MSNPFTDANVQSTMRKLLLVPFVVAALAAQTAPPAVAPAFEVASVKQNTSGENLIGVRLAPGGRFTATNVPLRQLITMAYQVQPFQIDGGPVWLASDRFDIVAKAAGELPPPQPGTVGPLQMMMRSLLADRFKLVVRNERKEMAIYALVLGRTDGKLGTQLHQSTTDCAALMAGRRGAPPPGPPSLTDPIPCGMRIMPGNLSAGSVPMSQLVQILSQNLQRVVVDRTGLTGNFDANLMWTPDQMPRQGDLPPGAPALPPIDPNGPSLFTALQEQLGLKLDSTKGPVDVVVIDRAEKPTTD